MYIKGCYCGKVIVVDGGWFVNCFLFEMVLVIGIFGIRIIEVGVFFGEDEKEVVIYVLVVEGI